MIFNTESIKVLKEVINYSNEALFIYDFSKKKILLFNKPVENLLNFNNHAKPENLLKDIVENIPKNIFTDKKKFEEEIYCQNLIVPTNFVIKVKYIINSVVVISIEPKDKNLENEELLKNYSEVLKSYSRIVAIINKNADFEYVNDNLLNIFGFNKSNIIGSNLFTLGINNKKFQNLKIWKTIAKGSVWEGEIQTSKNLGDDIFLQTTIIPIKKDEKINKFIITAEDITEKRTIEKKLKTVEKKKDLILNAFPDTIIVIDEKGIFTDYKSEKTEKLIPIEPVIGKSITEVGLPDDLVKKLLNALRFCIKSRRIKQFNYHHLKKDKIYECRLLALNDNEVVCIMRNITKKTVAEKLLKNREKSYKSMVESFPSGIIIHKNNRIVYCNKLALKYLGCKDLRTLRKHNIFDLIPEELQALSKERLEKVLAGKNVPFMEFPIKRLDNNKYKPFETKPVLFDFYGDKVCQIVIRDMSVQKRLIKETIRAQMAEETNKKILLEIQIRKKTEENLKKSLAEKELLIKEIHHRVKNNMQVMTSILNLQANSIDDKYLKNIFEESQNRIKSMALVHENIYANKDFSNICFKNYIDNLTDNLLRSEDVKIKKILLTKKISNFYLPVTLSVPCGLIINEILSLSIKRFFVEISKKNSIFVEANLNINEVQIKISDNAKSIKDMKAMEHSHSLSFLLINALIDQINGKISIESNQETVFKINFNI